MIFGIQPMETPNIPYILALGQTDQKQPIKDNAEWNFPLQTTISKKRIE